ncbi:MAG: hypothetical protein MMC33_000948 [Icmadophila ericetorum]|nr:hypothetical protein [Icmadophila ericetorum]
MASPDPTPHALTETSSLLLPPSDKHSNQHDMNYSACESALKTPEEPPTTWRYEARILATSSQKLILTFLLQYSLNIASIISVGHLGKTELGAASLASVTANITGYALYSGLACSLDTLCPQAFGSGKKKLVGLQCQRMVLFLWLVTIPIAVVWFNAGAILSKIIPDQEVAVLAGQYLRVLIPGIPAMAVFESGKRYVQAQGLFTATLCVLLVCAPTNALLNWLFVWKLQWGFLGSPTAILVVLWLQPTLLWLYIALISGSECWGGFSSLAFRNWTPMIRLAIPSLVMVEAELFGFEILTLLSSYFSTAHLATQSVITTTALLAWVIPFAISIAGGTRIATLIGAGQPQTAKLVSAVSLTSAGVIGTVSATLIALLRNHLPRLFTTDPEVIALASHILPIIAIYQIFDSLVASCHGILRGLGRQKIGGYVVLFSWYVIGLPVAVGCGFGAGWELLGLWSGVTLALFVSCSIEGVVIWKTDWMKMVEQAVKRNERE